MQLLSGAEQTYSSAPLNIWAAVSYLLRAPHDFVCVVLHFL